MKYYKKTEPHNDDRPADVTIEVCISIRVLTAALYVLWERHHLPQWILLLQGGLGIHPLNLISFLYY